MNKFTVTCRHGDGMTWERHHHGDFFQICDGHLVIMEGGEENAAYAPGSWVLIEKEAKCTQERS